MEGTSTWAEQKSIWIYVFKYLFVKENVKSKHCNGMIIEVEYTITFELMYEKNNKHSTNPS